ncbi:hypothetical protein [Geothrix edaphica]|uniref:Uncharacterized protein n=1 Tax=Geothrix edaphica TaxID=2927976 RepID=A0ABQ5Q0Z6_9BACT|nr:hypothetical protein [Geothrix edaphica]GLH68055.1 hypothetical protein GETHED_24190 [Geothrix edaphica]
MHRPVISVLALLVSTLLRAQIGLHNEAPPPKPQSSQSGDALSQLEAITKTKVDRSKVGTSFKVQKTVIPKLKPVPWINTTSGQNATMLVGIFGNLLSQALTPTSPTGPSPAELARIEAERQAALQREQAELQAWTNSYATRMNGLIEHQRQERMAQNKESLEGLRASLSDGFDSAAGGGLAGALSDPAPVVDLSQSQTFTPSLLREANGTKRTKPITADDLLKRREAAQARLKRMMAENKDLRVLGQRFYELEAQLERLKRQAASLGAEGRAIQRDMDFWGWRIDQATQACMERGTSLLTDIIIPEGNSAGLARLKKNPKTFNRLVQACSQLNDYTEFTTTLGDRYDAAEQALDWPKAKHTLMEHVDFIASNLQNVSPVFKPVSTTWSLGKTIIGTSVDLAAELDGWGAILERQGDVSLILQKQKALKRPLDAMIRDLQASRAQIAAQLGVKPEDLIPVQARPKGLGSNVAPL